jgi:hypothetical protein
VQVAVGVTCEPAGVVGLGDPALGRFGDLAEVQPPQRAGDQERERQRGDDAGREPAGARRRAVITIDWPSAMITNAWKRSAKWLPSTSQSDVSDRPSNGVR